MSEVRIQVSEGTEGAEADVKVMSDMESPDEIISAIVAAFAIVVKQVSQMEGVDHAKYFGSLRGYLDSLDENVRVKDKVMQ